MSFAISELPRLLKRAQNPDGGWGYFAGKTSRLEPTCWALLALGDVAGEAAVRRLATWPVRNHLLLERPTGEPNFAFHALALLTLLKRGFEHTSGSYALIRALQRVKGIAYEPTPMLKQDNSLQAWSWTRNTFSWVEPTAWCVLALKKWRAVPGAVVSAERLHVAERLLLDRMCADGGWNYGNSQVYGKDLRPYVATSSVGLLAMQDKRADVSIQRSVALLERAALSERSGTSLSLAMLALRAFGRPTDAVRAALERQIPTTIAIGNQMGLALTLYALGSELESHGSAVLLV
jgi:hypothetical protein